MMTKQFLCAAYVRLSKEDGDKNESDSVSNQKKMIEYYIEHNENFVLYDFYIDDGYTGVNFKRPSFLKMLEEIEQGKVNCVIVKDLSRFGRDYIETGKYLERYFPERDIRFIAITDNIDSKKQAYDMLLPIKNIFNEQYARDISKKVNAAMHTKQVAGDFIGAFAKYGYKKSPENKNRLIIDEYAANVVRRIFDMYVNG
ncbi:MAG: recombinase family protein, partial [Lachnospiraceae bacterium]|nr:recombinase family protein [Lachnospiraceae bacterium]